MSICLTDLLMFPCASPGSMIRQKGERKVVSTEKVRSGLSTEFKVSATLLARREPRRDRFTRVRLDG